MAMPSPLPVRDGVGATRLRIPRTGPWNTVAEYMVARFDHLDPELLRARFPRGEIVDAAARPLALDTPLGTLDFVWYYREPPVEREIPFDVDILHIDNDLVVVDKPHFLPTTPGGKFLQNSALVRLRNQLDIPELTPIHRLDRSTAGLLMFSARPATRGAYQMLFQRRAIAKVYEAVSPRPTHLPDFPLTVRMHIEKLRGEITVRTDSAREPNSETPIELITANDEVVHTLLRPHSGKMHQLRVHLASLGMGILHDPLYPVLTPEQPDDFARPLQLLAREVRFVDPLHGGERIFTTRQSLAFAP